MPELHMPDLVRGLVQVGVGAAGKHAGVCRDPVADVQHAGLAAADQVDNLDNLTI